MAYIKTGWIYHPEGAGPEKVWDPSNQQMAPKPPGPKKFKRGFEVQFFSNALIPGTKEKIGLREFSSTANVVLESINEMYEEFEAGAAKNPGKVPVYHLTGVKPVEGSYGTNYKPLFVLKQWVDRSLIPDFDRVKEEPPQDSEHPAGDAMDDSIPF
jgi:hypothetical protein